MLPLFPYVFLFFFACANQSVAVNMEKKTAKVELSASFPLFFRLCMIGELHISK